MEAKMKSQHILIRFLLRSMAKCSHISYGTLTSFKNQHTTYITTITKGKGESWNIWRKATSITKTSKISLLHMREVEERKDNKIARLTYLGL